MSDPIIEEIWAIKDKLANEAEDMDQFCEKLRRWAAENPAKFQAGSVNEIAGAGSLELREEPPQPDRT